MGRPARPAAGAMALSRPAPARAVGPGSRRILVADDDQAVRRVFAAILRENGFEVTTAVDGLDALDLLSREAFAVVLLDYRMPRLDGLGVLRRLQQTGVEMPVILTSGSLDARSELEALGLGAAALLRKPPDLSRLVRLCRELGSMAPGVPPLRR